MTGQQRLLNYHEREIGNQVGDPGILRVYDGGNLERKETIAIAIIEAIAEIRTIKIASFEAWVTH